MSRNIKDLIIRVSALASVVMIATACPEQNLTVPVSSVSLNTTSITLTLGDRDNESYQLQATVNPSNAGNKDVNWSSNNGTVASVDVLTGLVKAKAKGDAVITVTTVDGNKTATCKVKVETKTYPVKEIKINKSTAEVAVGETITLIATVLPSNATDKSVEWSSNNPNVAKVENGKVTGIKAGKTTITVSSVENKDIEATCDVTVVAGKVSVTGVELDKTSLVMTEGEEETLTVTIEPENADNKNVNWSSSRTSVATVANGKVVAKAAGTSVITVTTEDGGYTATCTVTVEPNKISVTGVKLNKTSLAMTKGDEETLKATVEPEEATDKSVEWRSDHPEIADVDEKTGKVTAKDGGEANIIVKTIDGEFSDTCKVTVSVPVEGVKIELDGTEIENLEKTVGETFTLKAKIEPSNATNQNVTWNSLDATVATVDPKNGKVTAKKAGFTVITVTTEDGGHSATCEITVLKEYENEDGEKVEDEDGEW